MLLVSLVSENAHRCQGHFFCQAMELPYAVEKTPLGRCERAGNAADFHRAHLQMGVVIIVMPAPSPTSSKLNVLQTSGHRRKRGFPRNSDFKVWGCPPCF